MSKMGQYFYEIQEDAVNLIEDAFIEKYSVNGRISADIMDIYFEAELGSCTDRPIWKGYWA